MRQGIWLDNSTRDMLTSGTLKHYIDELSVTGLTANRRSSTTQSRTALLTMPRSTRSSRKASPAANRRRIPEGISVGANPLSASQRNLLHKGDLPNDAICRPPAHN